MPFIIYTPTTTRAGAVAKDGIALITFEKNKKGKNNKPIVTAVKPALLPSSTPDADSIYVVPELVPRGPEIVVEIASTRRAFPTLIG